MNKVEINRKGYNKIASKYNEERNIYNNSKELAYFLQLLPSNAKVLDVGCGTGVPVAQFLVANGCNVIGIDISANMLELAKKQVPEAKFIEQDMIQSIFPNESFDGIISLYAIFHVPKEEHLSIFQNFYRILKKGGILHFCLSASANEGNDYMYETELFWSSYSPEKSISLVKQAGFEILSDEILNRGNEEQCWVFAKKK